LTIAAGTVGTDRSLLSEVSADSAASVIGKPIRCNLARIIAIP
jgi:hypothetical protein